MPRGRYSGPAFSAVKITRADGTVEVEPAKRETKEQRFARVGRTPPKPPRRNPLDSRCPTCGAKPGRACRSSTGRPHPARSWTRRRPPRLKTVFERQAEAKRRG